MQFSIRSLVILIAMAAVFCVYATELLEMVFYYRRYYIPIAVLLLIGTWFAAQRFVMRWKSWQRSYLISSFVFAGGMLVLVAALWFGWARFRWGNLYFTGKFPYPDTLLLEFCNWLDARNPAPPGTIKIDGEINTVLFILTLAVYTLSLFAGVLLGLSLRPDGVFGLAFWKSHIVKAFKRCAPYVSE